MSSFYFFNTANKIKKEYNYFLDNTKAPDLSIYNKDISLYVNNHNLIEKNRKRYICGYINIRNLCQIFSKDRINDLQIERIEYIKDDIIKIDWVYYCLKMITMKGSSLYMIDRENEKVKEHYVTFDTMNIIRKYDEKYYKHPNLYKPIYIKPEKK